MKKGIILLAITAILMAGWSGVWHFVTGKVETTLADTKTKLTQRGREVECSNQEINGYPFRISINCDAVKYKDTITGISFEGGKLKTAAQAYQPNKAIAELSSPASLTLANGNKVDATWELMRSSIKMGLSGPQNISVQGTKITLSPTQFSAQPVQIDDMQFHGRLMDENNINLAVTLDNTTAQGNPWPGFDLRSTVLLNDAYKDILDRQSILRIARDKGLEGEIQRFQYAPIDGGALEFSGPAKINPQGLLSGQLQVTLRDLPKLVTALGKSFPKEKQKFDDASTAINLLAQKSGNNEISFPVSIRDGRASIGLIPLGKIEPLF